MSSSLVIILVAVTAALASVRNSRMTWSAAIRHPTLYGAAIGLGSGWLFSIWAAGKVEGSGAMAIFGFWGAYIFTWIGVFLLLARFRSGASNAI